MHLDIYQVDSFTTEAFKGNPAGVCITSNRLSESLMLSIAEEMAVSETVFLSTSDMTLRRFNAKYGGEIVCSWKTGNCSRTYRNRAG